MNPIRFIHISDTHLGSDKKYIQRNVNSYQAFSQFLNEIKKLPFRPDFIIHTGDITADCFDKGYKLMSDVIHESPIPFYFVAGNHDRSEQIKKFLPMKNTKVLSKSLNCYRFEFGDHCFLTLDGRGPDKIDPHGIISDEQMDLLKKEFDLGKNLTIFIHYPALSLDSAWFDQNMLLTNGQEFHQLLVEYNTQVRGVFFGQIHRSTQTFQDGILYSSVGSTSSQFILNPGQKVPMFESTGRGYFNIISIDESKATIKEQTFANGQKVYQYKT